MRDQLTIVIGGIQGEGIVSTGGHLIKILSTLGYYGFSNRKFSSRIRGGNTAMQITISTKKVTAVEDKIDIILALDKDTIALHKDKLKDDGIILYDDGLKGEEGDDMENTLIAIPITNIAKKFGTPIMKTTSAIGFLGEIMNIPIDIIKEYFQEKFNNKGIKIQEGNLKVLEETLNYDFIILEKDRKPLKPPLEVIRRPVMIGNEAIAIGAIMAGCRFMAAYPITPASEIMELLGKLLPKYGGIMVQVEDEIAAINMIIGGGYGGVRSITATSGPGISLMMEGIGMASMAEVPVVLVDCQRVGPSTGMPTRHEQSDLFTLYYGGHGDYPVIILTPSTVEESFEDTVKAFNLAEAYQCPVILVTDLVLSLATQTIDPLDYSLVQIHRGKVLRKEDLQSMESSPFKRFGYTDDGVSPRSIPGAEGEVHHVTAVEHREDGLPTEDADTREKMMEKRFRKTQTLETQENVKLTSNGSDTLFLAIGSTFGVLKEAVAVSGNKVDFGTIRMLRPLPTHQLKRLFKDYRKVFILENNYREQLASILREELGYHDKLQGYTKYDGNPFTVEEIAEKIGGL